MSSVFLAGAVHSPHKEGTHYRVYEELLLLNTKAAQLQSGQRPDKTWGAHRHQRDAHSNHRAAPPHTCQTDQRAALPLWAHT